MSMPGEPQSEATVVDSKEVEQPEAISAAAPPAPEAQPQPGFVEIEGRQMTPEQAQQYVAELHRSYTQASQQASAYEGVLRDFGFLDEVEGPQAAGAGAPQGYQGVAPPATPSPTNPAQPYAGQPYAQAPEQPVPNAQAAAPPDVSERLEALEALQERIDFKLNHPELGPAGVEAIERLRDQKETRFRIPFMLESVWAEQIVAASRLDMGKRAAEQTRQAALQSAQAAQRQASQQAPPVIPGAGGVPSGAPQPVRSIEEAIQRAAPMAAEEMAGQGHQ